MASVGKLACQQVVLPCIANLLRFTNPVAPWWIHFTKGANSDGLDRGRGRTEEEFGWGDGEKIPSVGVKVLSSFGGLCFNQKFQGTFVVGNPLDYHRGMTSTIPLPKCRSRIEIIASWTITSGLGIGDSGLDERELDWVGQVNGNELDASEFEWPGRYNTENPVAMFEKSRVGRQRAGRQEEGMGWARRSWTAGI
ncbi:hypothetical protein BDN72DRAFT_861194 [Pluteus cervinus]|uniref:Uncharacterized protein n=1 Tax=Pluteus cervinus TaxID=181527 RepID=A0ACD3AFK7_9AGAR|nr:hypothetical protein BDN72DRAFT_861194 [Pluteus cervinus]